MLTEEEKLQISLISKYALKEVKDVIEETENFIIQKSLDMTDTEKVEKIAEILKDYYCWEFNGNHGSFILKPEKHAREIASLYRVDREKIKDIVTVGMNATYKCNNYCKSAFTNCEECAVFKEAMVSADAIMEESQISQESIDSMNKANRIYRDEQ